MARPKEFDRNRVLEKAMEVFWRLGYDATSVADLVEGTGVNRQSLYDTFGDKRALFLECLTYYQQQGLAEAYCQLDQPGTVQERLQQYMWLASIASREGQRPPGCMVINAAVELGPRDPEICKQVAGDIQATEELFYQNLQRAQVNGELGDGSRDLRALARFLANSMRGIQVLTRTNPDLATLEDIINVTVSVLN